MERVIQKINYQDKEKLGELKQFLDSTRETPYSYEEIIQLAILNLHQVIIKK
ncbi:hypothetical protein AB3N04_01215 (plasmid) [Alkalihalophilus sp. As8PL]|uniref:Uncharacterized protein n=1 Tax=Alkalihalophilus sp. As8PL TaxID=3237103 RepID=A0AB39BNL7_9BACI